MEANRTIRLAGGSLAVRVTGQGPAILFVHGFPLDRQMWNGQLPLAERFCCIMPDLRGFGASAADVGDVLTMSQFADDLECLLTQTVGDQPVCVCGLSMGGYIAFALWQLCAQRIGRLILCDTRAAADSPEVARGRQLSADTIAAEGSSAFVAGMLGRLFSPAASNSCRESTLRVMQSTSPATLSAALRGMAQRLDFTPRLAEIRCPTLVLCGNQDGISPPAEMRHMASQLPRGHFAEVPDAGHLAPLEQPEFVNAQIMQFMS